MKGTVIIILLILVACILIVYKKNEPFTSDIDAYVINLPRRSDRLAQFKEKYYNSELATNNLVIVEAIDGSNLNNIDGFTPESTQKIIKTGKRKSHDELTPGMIGCYLSHYKTYQEFLDSGKPYAFIFEDDSEIIPKFGDALNNLPQDWDIVMFGVQSCMDCPIFDSKFKRLHDFYGAGGYLINRQGAMKIIQNKEDPIAHQIDLLMAKLCKEGKMNIYSVKNNLVNTAHMGTDVQMGLS